MFFKFVEKFNFFKQFNKDLNIAILNKVHQKANYINKGNKNLFIWVYAGIFYILAKAWYIYYKGKFLRKERIKKLKEECKYIL